MKVSILGTQYTIEKKRGADEELIDWIAIQFPKILKVFEGANCL
nr:hypothetical protein [uncultured Anaerostipes sp.]